MLYLRNAWIFLHQISLICLAQNCALIYCFVLYLRDTKLPETQTSSRTNFTSQLNKTLILSNKYHLCCAWRHYRCVCVHHSNDSTVILNSSKFQVIIAVRPTTTLVVGKLSYEDKQASLFAQLINKDIISMNNVQGQAARKAHKAQHCWPPCK